MPDSSKTSIEDIANQLRRKYNRSVLSKKELANELNIGISTLNNYIMQ
jgi:hypothetical protein